MLISKSRDLSYKFIQKSFIQNFDVFSRVDDPLRIDKIKIKGKLNVDDVNE